MASFITYNFKSCKSGRTFPGVVFTVKVNGSAKDLTDVVINMNIGGTRLSNTTGELLVTDAAGGKFQVKRQVINILPGNYVYDITFESEAAGNSYDITFESEAAGNSYMGGGGGGGGGTTVAAGVAGMPGGAGGSHGGGGVGMNAGLGGAGGSGGVGAIYVYSW